jgi:hypothetical protein
MRAILRVLLATTALAAGVLAPAAPARTEPAACRAAIIKATAAFVQAKVRALQRCRGQIVRGVIAKGSSCDANADLVSALGDARTRLRAEIFASCGGPDRTCGSADDDALADIGWDLGACPNFRGGACDAPVTSCADIPSCLECIGDDAVDQLIGLAYDSLVSIEPATEPELNRCQAAIGRAAAKLVGARSRALARCWRAVDRGRAAAPCPDPGDGKAQGAIEDAEAQKDETICGACGGADGACGGTDDLTPPAIGFPSECPDVAACGGPVTTLDELVTCVDCVAAFDGDCADRAAVPALADYPPECNPPLNPQLDPSLASVFGLVSLATTFVPDPFSIGLTAGGPVSASYLGGGCYGFATAAPTLTVSYAGGASLLRFYFIGSGDTTLLIRTPSGAFVCVDDSFGTLNPTLDFNSPAAGAYQVWNATYAQGASIGGTLFVTTNAANHP